jgi:hypothetical protein
MKTMLKFTDPKTGAEVVTGVESGQGLVFYDNPLEAIVTVYLSVGPCVQFLAHPHKGYFAGEERDKYMVFVGTGEMEGCLIWRFRNESVLYMTTQITKEERAHIISPVGPGVVEGKCLVRAK